MLHSNQDSTLIQIQNTVLFFKDLEEETHTNRDTHPQPHTPRVQRISLHLRKKILSMTELGSPKAVGKSKL